MKSKPSLKSRKLEPGSKIVRRRGRQYVVNKINPRAKTRQA